MMESEALRSMRLASLLAVIGAACASACGGPEFQTSGCDDESCAGGDSGGTSSGGGTAAAGEGGEATGGSGGSAGASTGGRGGSGTGGSGAGGTDVGGSDTGGSDAGGSGGLDGEFPTTRVLDTFNREGPAPGANWVGGMDAYDVLNQTLQCAGGYCPATFWHQIFGPSHEVFATLSGFSESAEEINLVLAAQGNPACDLIEVLYSPTRQLVLIEACWDSTFTSFGTLDVFFEPGDQLGGRLRSDGFLEVFKNGTLVGSVDANGYPYIGLDGYIGVNAISDPLVPDVWDDFGGGGG
jgi:hypothetical protein